MRPRPAAPGAPRPSLIRPRCLEAPRRAPALSFTLCPLCRRHRHSKMAFLPVTQPPFARVRPRRGSRVLRECVCVYSHACMRSSPIEGHGQGRYRGGEGKGRGAHALQVAACMGLLTKGRQTRRSGVQAHKNRAELHCGGEGKDEAWGQANSWNWNCWQGGVRSTVEKNLRIVHEG